MAEDTAQRLVELPVSSGSPERAAHALTRAAAEGYRYRDASHRLAVRGGGAMGRRRGIYTDSYLVRLDRVEHPSLFRAYRIPIHRGRDHAQDLNRVLAAEGRQGFRMVACWPLDGIVQDRGESGYGTVAYFVLLERRGDVQTPLSLDRWVMKETRGTGDQIACPVIGCDFEAPRMKAIGPNLDRERDQLGPYLCPTHRIWVSPSTFEYEDPDCSILWRDAGPLADLRDLCNVKGGKRTWARRGRERDEDSLTWNLFTHLERHDLLGPFLSKLLTAPIPIHQLGTLQRVVYWSVDRASRKVWDELKQARQLLHESADTGSEPDVIIVGSRLVVLVEAKFGAPSITPKSPGLVHYQDGPGSLANTLFNGDLTRTADEIGYELTRFFLLGAQLGQLLNRRFVVVSLTRSSADRGLSDKVDKALRNQGHFVHTDWKAVQGLLTMNPPLGKVDPLDQSRLWKYLEGKTRGYDSKGELQTLV